MSSVQDAKKTNKHKVEGNRNAAIAGARAANVLARQIGLELNNQYLLGIWYDINSLFGQAAYMYHLAQEEHGHAQ